MDIVVRSNNRIFIIELKFNKSAADGLPQIKDKDYAKKFRVEYSSITALGINIALKKDTLDAKGPNRCIIEIAIEQL